MALRSETRSSSGSGAEEHRESRALYKAMAAAQLAIVQYIEKKISPATRCRVDLIGWRKRGMHPYVVALVWCCVAAQKHETF
jgi:hypothetical protein